MNRLLLFNCFMICIGQMVAQTVPEIYTGDKDSPCSGAELFTLYQSCANGNGGDCNKVEIKRKWIIENCKADGIVESSSDNEEVKKEEIKKISPPKPPWTKTTTPSTECPPYWGTLCEIDNSSVVFKYCRVIEKECVCNNASIKSFGINTTSDKIQGNDYLSIAIPKKMEEIHLPPYKHEDETSEWAYSIDDITSKYDFVIITKSQDGIWMNKRTGNEIITGLDPNIFNSTGSGLLRKLAIIKYFDKNLQILKMPSKDILKLVVSGNANGRNYLVGIDQNTYYEPIKLSDPVASQKLVEIMTRGGLKSPLKELINDWYNKDSQHYIIACVEGMISPRKYSNPQDALNSGGRQFSGSTTNLTFILSDGRVVGHGIEKIEAPWYKQVSHFNNANLALLAVADPYCTVFDVDIDRDRLVLVTGNSDNIYVLNVKKGSNERPDIKALIDTATYSAQDIKLRIGKCIADKKFYERQYKNLARDISFD